MSNIIITGANGNLGKEMINLLNKEELKFTPVKIRYDSLSSDLRYLNKLNPSLFLHLGALTPSNQVNKFSHKDYYENNVITTLSLANYAKEKNIRFIYISTADLFNRYQAPASESGNITITIDSITGSKYGWSKYQAEKELKELEGINIIFRISTIYNIETPSHFSCARLFRNKQDVKNFKFKKEQFLMNFIRSDLLAQAILEISMKKKLCSNIFNFTSSNWISNFDIVNIYAQKFGIRKIEQKYSLAIPRRFNASNLSIKKALGSNFCDSNYLEDLKRHLSDQIL